MIDNDRTLQDWGTYEPEMQKALRFVSSFAGEGAAKQVARAIDNEYTTRSTSNQVQPPKKPVTQKKHALSEDDLAVLKITELGQIEIEDAIRISGLEQKHFFQCIDHLVKQRYLQGDVLLGFYRTKKYP